MKTPPPPLFHSIIDVIGNTPLLELHRAVESRGLRGRILAKLEHMSPGASKKDRIAMEIILHAKDCGLLRDGQSVLELTSGNTGTGLAIVCRAMGHPFVAVMSKGNSVERARMMMALGAEVVLVDQAAGSVPGQVSGEDLALCEVKTIQLLGERDAFRADQFQREANSLAHERHTGPEIWQQANGRVDVFIDFVGTGGSFVGVTRYLRKVNPKLRAYLIEPSGAPALAGRGSTRPSHKIQGGGYAKPELALLDRSLVSDFLCVSDEDAIAGARALAAEEGVFAGFSAGAHLAVALDLLREREAGATIAFLVCDSGLKYLSTDLFP